MTHDEAVSALVSLAYDQVGYKEGPDNWNKYADLPEITLLFGWSLQNQPWCCIFIAYLFIQAFGYYQGTQMIFEGSPSCAVAAGKFQQNYAFHDTPEKGDQIFFYAGGGINHTGLVVDISGNTITTIEGNYSDGVSLVTHFTHDASIAGYGRPKWDLVAKDPDPVEEPESDSEPQEDAGIVMPKIQYGDKGYSVMVAQAILIANGYSCGVDGADGDFGSNTLLAVKRYQKAKDLNSDGSIGPQTWKSLLEG